MKAKTMASSRESNSVEQKERKTVKYLGASTGCSMGALSD